jgi:chromosome segregation ATPase
MEQVRELLFGTQMKEVDTRFQRQDERFERKIADVREALKTRLDSLENFMKSEISSLLHRLKEEQSERDSALKDEQRERAETFRNEQRERSEGLKHEQHERAEAIKNEQRERAEALAHLAKELASAVETFERKNSKVADALDAAERELRQLMMTENTALSAKIEEKYQDALNVLSSTAEQIRDDMVYRSSLSGMFTETALKLSGQWSDVSRSPEREASVTGGGEDSSSDDA